MKIVVTRDEFTRAALLNLEVYPHKSTVESMKLGKGNILQFIQPTGDIINCSVVEFKQAALKQLSIVLTNQASFLGSFESEYDSAEQAYVFNLNKPKKVKADEAQGDTRVQERGGADRGVTGSSKGRRRPRGRR